MCFRRLPLLVSFIFLVFMQVSAQSDEEMGENLDEVKEYEVLNDDNVQVVQNGSDIQVENPKLNDTSNGTVGNSTNVNNGTFQVSCIQNRTLVAEPVEIVNSTRLTGILQMDPNVTSRLVPGNCVAVLFYSPSCPFSCKAAPHFNALPRYFPDIKMVAIDALTHRSSNAHYGIFGIPILILFHNGRPAARLNETRYNLEKFAKFIKTCSNVKPVGKMVVTSSDFAGPISSVPVNEEDYYLLLSWSVIALTLLHIFYRSSWGRWLVDATLSAWREAEAQQLHID